MSDLKIQAFDIDGPLLITPQVYGDDRGFFQESWNLIAFNKSLSNHGQIAPQFLQDNHSSSCRGVLRGLHMQVYPCPQAKLVRCVVGEIFDVAVDLRPESSSYGKWVGVHLSADNHQQFWIPEGFAHGFLTLSSRADVLYKTNNYWSKESERSFRWNDPTLAIGWPLQNLGDLQPILSAKDEVAPFLL
jgi:dTDP-4-dehydrorhamnose 3,5-epimerase